MILLHRLQPHCPSYCTLNTHTANFCDLCPCRAPFQSHDAAWVQMVSLHTLGQGRKGSGEPPACLLHSGTMQPTLTTLTLCQLCPAGLGQFISGSVSGGKHGGYCHSALRGQDCSVFSINFYGVSVGQSDTILGMNIQA